MEPATLLVSVDLHFNFLELISEVNLTCLNCIWFFEPWCLLSSVSSQLWSACRAFDQCNAATGLFIIWVLTFCGAPKSNPHWASWLIKIRFYYHMFWIVKDKSWKLYSMPIFLPLTSVQFTAWFSVFIFFLILQHCFDVDLITTVLILCGSFCLCWKKCVTAKPQTPVYSVDVFSVTMQCC